MPILRGHSPSSLLGDVRTLLRQRELGPVRSCVRSRRIVLGRLKATVPLQHLIMAEPHKALHADDGVVRMEPPRSIGLVAAPPLSAMPMRQSPKLNSRLEVLSPHAPAPNDA